MATEIQAGPYKKLFTKIKTLKERLEKVLNTPGFDVSEVTQLRENIEFFEDKLQEQRKAKEEKRRETQQKIQDAKDSLQPEKEPAKELSKTEPPKTEDPSEKPVSEAPIQSEPVADAPAEVHGDTPTVDVASVPVEAATEKEADTNKFAFNDLVEPVAGTPGSWGRVIHHNADHDEVFVEWMDGKLRDRDGFGAYSYNDLKRRASLKKKAYVSHDILPNGDLQFTVDDAREISELFLKHQQSDAGIYDALEHAIGNSELEWISPEDIGALTDAPIIGITEQDDYGNILNVKEVWWYPNYQVRSPLEDLVETGKVIFQKAPQEEGQKAESSKKKKNNKKSELLHSDECDKCGTEKRYPGQCRTCKKNKEVGDYRKDAELVPGEKKMREEREKKFQEKKKKLLPREDIEKEVKDYEKKRKHASIKLSKYDKEGKEMKKQADALEILKRLLNTTELNLDEMEPHTREVVEEAYNYIRQANHGEKEAEGSESLRIVERNPNDLTDPSEKGTGYNDISHAPKTEDTSIEAEEGVAEKIPLRVFNQDWVAQHTSGRPGVPRAYVIHDTDGQLALVIKLKDETKSLNKDQLEEILFNEYGQRQLVWATLKHDAKPLKAGDKVLVAGYDRKTKKIKALNSEDKKFIGWAPRRIFTFDLDASVKKTLAEFKPKKDVKLSKLDVTSNFQVGDRVLSEKKGEGTVTYASGGYVSVQWDNEPEILGPEPIRPAQQKELKKLEADVDKQAQPQGKPPRLPDPGYEWVLVEGEWYQKPVGQG